MSGYEQMPTDKLTAIMEVVGSEERAEIEKIIRARQDGAEKEEAVAAPLAENGRKVAIRLTDEQRTEVAERLRHEAVNHRCKAVPVNSLTWKDGTVVDIIEDRRTNKVYLKVLLDNGQRLLKSHDSEFIQILPEKVERLSGERIEHTEKDSLPWGKEEIEKAVRAVIGNVGKTVEYPEAGAYGLVLGDGKTVTGRIVSIVPSRQLKNVMYRIEINSPDGRKKYAHKLTTSAIKIADTLDEEGEKINKAFRENRYKDTESKEEGMTPKQFFDYAAEMYAKAKKEAERAQRLLEKREAVYLEAKRKYEMSI